MRDDLRNKSLTSVAGVRQEPVPKTRGQLRQKLENDPLRDYHASRFTYWGELFVQNLPLWRLWTARMMLTSDPVVTFSLNVRNAALMAAEVVVTAKRPEVQDWVQKQWDFLWAHHRPTLVNAKKWGFNAFQFLFRTDKNGIKHIRDVREFAPEDVRGLEQRNKLVGVRVKGQPLYFPQACWVSYEAEFGSPYGTAVTRRQYPPWYEKWMERGAKRLQQLRMIKDAYIGDIFWYPPDVLLELPDGTTLPWKDVMREIAENRLSGGAITMPMKLDSNGKELTRYTPPQSIPGVSDIFNWVKSCDDDMMKAAGVPLEVVEAADVGSGFSGRSIPFLVLLAGCQGELVEIVHGVDRSLRLLAWLNFGGDPEYTIEARPLVETFSDSMTGTPMAGGSIGQPASAGPPQPGQGQGQPQQFDELPGGKGDLVKPSDFDHEQVAAGIKVEMEHTSDPKKALEIALDHLTEDPEYYTKLKHAGLADELKDGEQFTELLTHEQVLAKHGYTPGERINDQQQYHHANGSTITLGPVEERTGKQHPVRFWAISHEHDPVPQFYGHTGMHSSRHLDRAIKTSHRLLASQHGEQRVPKSERVKRALASHNPSTKEKQDESERFEHHVAKHLGLDRSGDNRPMDAHTRDHKVGVELKVLHDAKEGRVNMRPDSRKRKEGWLKENKHRKAYTVLIDNRDKFQGGAHKHKYSGHKYYYHEGVGAFRLDKMKKARSLKHLKEVIHS